MVNKCSGNSDLHRLGHCDQQSYRFLKLTPLLHVSLVTRRSSPAVTVFKMCVHRGGSEPPCSETFFISNLLWGAFRMSLIIQVMKIAEKKSKSTNILVQQTTDGAQPTKSAANQHRVHEVICNALLVHNGFSRSKTENKRLAT